MRCLFFKYFLCLHILFQSRHSMRKVEVSDICRTMTEHRGKWYLSKALCRERRFSVKSWKRKSKWELQERYLFSGNHPCVSNRNVRISEFVEDVPSNILVRWPRSRSSQRVLEDNLWHIGRIRAENVLRPIHGPYWRYRYRARLSVNYVPKREEYWSVSGKSSPDMLWT